jgi:general secretion pathway protein E
VRAQLAHCKEPAEPAAQEWRSLVQPFRSALPDRVYQPVGCLECRNTGYLGRTGLYELLQMTPAMRELVDPQCETAAIRRQGLREQMRPLRLAGAQKVAAGLTTAAEVMRVTPPAQGG